jgi:hypothetical protein
MQGVFDAVSPALSYSAQEMLLNCVTLAMGNAVVLPTAFGLRDYTIETIRDQLRDDPATYISKKDFEQIAQPIAAIVAQRETNGNAAEALHIVNDVFDSWFSTVRAVGLPPTILACDSLSRLHRLFDAAASVMFPRLVAEHLEIDRQVFGGLMLGQREFVRWRRSDSAH